MMAFPDGDFVGEDFPRGGSGEDFDSYGTSTPSAFVNRGEEAYPNPLVDVDFISAITHPSVLYYAFKQRTGKTHLVMVQLGRE